MGDMAEANNLRQSSDKKPKKKKIKSQKKMIYQKIIHHKNNLPESGTNNDIGFFSPKMEMTMILTQNGEMKLREGKIFLMC